MESIALPIALLAISLNCFMAGMIQLIHTKNVKRLETHIEQLRRRLENHGIYD